jgi:hypothetical protein
LHSLRILLFSLLNLHNLYASSGTLRIRED